jgi:hypothetical protein
MVEDYDEDYYYYTLFHLRSLSLSLSLSPVFISYRFTETWRFFVPFVLCVSWHSDLHCLQVTYLHDQCQI